MKAFEYVNPSDVKSAVAALTQGGTQSKIMAGGIDLLGEMKDYIRTPEVVVNLKSVSGMNKITADKNGLRIGALTTLVEIAEHPVIKEKYTALAESALSVASPQIRNVGTLGGNLCQRPRCWYYRDEEVKCLKKGGTKCYAVEGENEYNAILGGGPSWIVHPSDCAPALIALDSQIEITGPKGTRRIPIAKFFQLPSENVFNENVLKHNEVVTHIVDPAQPANSRSHYMKIRHREGFDWALAGAAVRLTMNGANVSDCRVVLSGVAPIPWRSTEAEAVLKGKALTAALAEQAGAASVVNAKPLGQNGYKVPLTRNTVKLAILHAAGVKA